MTDQEKRERVIALLERYVDIPNLAGVENYGVKIVDMPAPLIVDALALLKAQGPVEPIQDMVGDALFWVCGKCGHDISSSDWYCANCGRAVKWE